MEAAEDEELSVPNPPLVPSSSRLPLLSSLWSSSSGTGAPSLPVSSLPVSSLPVSVLRAAAEPRGPPDEASHSHRDILERFRTSLCSPPARVCVCVCVCASCRDLCALKVTADLTAGRVSWSQPSRRAALLSSGSVPNVLGAQREPWSPGGTAMRVLFVRRRSGGSEVTPRGD